MSEPVPPVLPELLLAHGAGRYLRAELIRSSLDPATADRYAARARGTAPRCAGR